MRSNAIKQREIFMLFTTLQRITLHQKFYNIFAYTTANSFTWSLIHPLIIEVQMAGRNGILVEFYYLVENNFRVIALSLMNRNGWCVFPKIIILSPHPVIREGKGTCVIFPFKSELPHKLKLDWKGFFLW